jgi:hypothetical protein
MKKTLIIELDERPGILSYDLGGEEALAVTMDGRAPTLYVNRAGAEVLAKVFAKLALGPYEPGFHIHLKENFDDEPAQDALTMVRQQIRRPQRID